MLDRYPCGVTGQVAQPTVADRFTMIGWIMQPFVIIGLLKVLLNVGAGVRFFFGKRLSARQTQLGWFYAC